MPRPGQVIYSRRNPSTTQTPEAILGSNLLDIFYASNATRSGAAVLSLTGQNGTVLTSSANNPNYHATDPSNYLTLPVIRFWSGYSTVLRNNNLGGTSPIIIPAGSRPFIWLLGYAHQFVDGQSLMVLSDSDTYTQHVRVFGNHYYASQYTHELGTKLSGGFVGGLGGQLLGTHVTPAGVSLWIYGGLDAPNATAGFVTPVDITTLTLGASHGGGFADCTIAVAGVCLALPTPAQLEALWYWGQLQIRR